MMKRVCVAVLIIAATGCGASSTSPSPAPAQASFTVSVLPSPITAVRCSPACSGTSGATFPFSATMTLAVQELAGVGGNINSITVTPSTGGGALPPLTYGSDVVIQRAGTNHLGARGTLSFPMTLVYSTGSGGAANLVVNIVVQFTDDRNNQLTATGQVSVV
jgi:hypothetical protein